METKIGTNEDSVAVMVCNVCGKLRDLNQMSRIESLIDNLNCLVSESHWQCNSCSEEIEAYAIEKLTKHLDETSK